MKICVENLPADVTEDLLKTVFAQIGEVESVTIKAELLSLHTNNYGIVEMSLDVDAYRAISCFEGATFKDKQIHVREQYPLFERARTMFEHLTDGRSMPSFHPLSALEQWKQQHWSN